ncbi:hypothetical protein SHKM778_80210 [Streptomyces sp. KM77-8]|uniref:Tyrosinase copper-binding domain-containing protein n=1 Tax=Streptomyces haneummycinicus TaxID=3074435 RepID=A0AAT9HWJ0_9ACTN
MAPWDSTVTRGFRNRLEGWGTGRGGVSWRNHNRVHRWVGGAMLGAASVNDPAFWLHHAFVDLQWYRWQRRHRGARYLPATAPGRGDEQHGRIVSRRRSSRRGTSPRRNWRTSAPSTATPDPRDGTRTAEEPRRPRRPGLFARGLYLLTQ